MKFLIPLAILISISCSASKKSDISVAEKSATVSNAPTETLKTEKTDTMDLPYHTIPDYPSNYSSGSMVGRMIDGLGYRYYWATKDLRPEDLAYNISEDSRPADETLDHLHGLSTTIVTVAQLKPNLRPSPKVEMTWEQKRKSTLMNLKEASDLFKAMDASNIGEAKIIFERGDKTSSFEFWHLLNGPIADAIYHVGQIVSYRRASGNPMDPSVSVFTGKNRG